MADNPDGINK
ncbi:hypothetical protein YPPY52_1501, partial [Yersinia pestis PY-52]